MGKIIQIIVKITSNIITISLMVVELLHNKFLFGNDLKTHTKYVKKKKCNWALNIGVRLIFWSYLRR